ncbi:hypothetical protein HMPREF3195_00366 [Peptostreptococcus anaerobius]|uniref:Uncharacterized protein n=1 Tax=Peptostreptococcus anaerobius TaxID=1261 RepID=A0A135YXT8_9FIRM|nr:hypothetical protein HMPREF3195_00366 [Peptostreptococcus anaerobius]
MYIRTVIHSDIKKLRSKFAFRKDFSECRCIGWKTLKNFKKHIDIMK